MNLPSGNVQETLFVPLWARAFATKNYPLFLNDRESVRIVDETGYDFTTIGESGEYYHLAGASRAANFDHEIMEYLKDYPEATIISIGSGLDTTFFRVDNGELRWYDLDLPEIITLRKKYIQQDDRARQISRSCFDYSWMDEIVCDHDKGVMFIVGGVFYYFTEDQVKGFITHVAERFTGARMIFDATTRQGLKVSNRYVKKTGNTGAEMHFGLNDAKKFFTGLSPCIRLDAQYPFHSKIKIDKNWSGSTRFKMKLSDLFKMVTLVRLKFIGSGQSETSSAAGFSEFQG